MNQLIFLMPILTVLASAVILMLLSMYDRYSTRRFIVLSSIFLLVALGFSIFTFGDMYSVRPYNDMFNNVLVFDSFSNFFTILLIFGTLITLLIGEHYFLHRKYFKGEFFTILMFSLFGMILLANANELITAFIALEIASFSVYVMVGYNSDDNKRVEAIFKYLVLGSFIGAFYLLGTVLIYGATQTTNLSQIAQFIATSSSEDLALVYIGITLLVLTFLFKIAAFPFQAWVLDVYRGAPMIVTAFMASVFKIAIFSFFLRLFLQDFSSMIDFWDNIIYVLTVLTLVFGTWLAVTQKIVKRMLAASSIVHTGYLLLAFIAMGQNTAAAYSTMFYLIAYLITALGSFGLVSHIISETNVRVTFDDFKGLSKERPFLAACMTVFLLSLAGIPSTIGFIGKFYVFTEAISAGFAPLAILAILATIVSVYYYFKLIAMMYFYPAKAACKSEGFNDKRVATYVIALMALITILGGIGSAIVFFIPIPNIDTMIQIAQMTVESLFLK